MERFGSSGARGRVDTELTPSVVVHIAQAAVTEWTASRVAIGRDVRVTGESLEAAVITGATAAGASVETLGVLPTPAVQAYANHESIPAIMVTASHNPPPDNGIKLIDADGGEVSVPVYEAVESRLDSGDHRPVSWREFGGVRRVEGAIRRYVERISDDLDVGLISDAGLRIVVDAGNGAGGESTPTLCRDLGCEVVTLNAQPDGHFPGRPSEPVPDALEDLATMVTATGADLGVAHDGDADRAIFVDELGTIVDGGASLSALAAAVTEPDDTIVAAITAPSSLGRVADDLGARLELTKVGAVNVLTRVRELQDSDESVAIAGEQNGGIIVPPFGLARDGAYALGMMLELVAEQPLSEVVAPYRDRAFRRRDITLETVGPTSALIDQARDWASRLDASVTETDGIRADFADRWVLIRPSGTEPLMRVYAEAPTTAAADSLIDEVVDAVFTADA